MTIHDVNELITKKQKIITIVKIHLVKPSAIFIVWHKWSTSKNIFSRALICSFNQNNNKQKIKLKHNRHTIFWFYSSIMNSILVNNFRKTKRGQCLFYCYNDIFSNIFIIVYKIWKRENFHYSSVYFKINNYS